MSATLSATRLGCKGLKTLFAQYGITDRLQTVLGSAVTIQVATLKATHGEKYPYGKPFPYWKKEYTNFQNYMDKTEPRLNENSKVLVVEGNVGVGKTEFAKQLAREFDLKFVPATPDSSLFTINEYGYDMRSLDPMLPASARTYDVSRFLADKHPERGTAGKLELGWIQTKFFDYCEALKHLLSTGQGVVMVRSVYSDIVFVDAMRRMGYLTAPFVKYYNDIRDASLCELLKPHMTIYLDAPVSVVRERINQRNDPRETGSKVLSDAFLQAIADVYREKYLPKMKLSGEVVEIDWTEKASEKEMDVIAEELQLYSLEPEDSEDVKFLDWNTIRVVDDDWINRRIFMHDRDEQTGCFVRPEPWDCPEIRIKEEDMMAVNDIYDTHPVHQYTKGWAPELGHKTMFKF